MSDARYRSVYPGIDLIFYGNQRQLEYDFVVSPGADPTTIKLVVDGVQEMNVDSQGDLVLKVMGGEVKLNKPLVYQEVDGRRQEISSRYMLKDHRELSFELAAYDNTQPLVIDPVLAYSTFLGGGGHDMAFGVAIDPAGNAYVVGRTNSPDFPTANPLQPVLAGSPPFYTLDAFVTKLNREGSEIIYSTYLGGNNQDDPRGIAVDKEGNVYVGGSTSSTDFPTANALQPALAGVNDAFITKLDSTGSALIYSSYLGGTRADGASDLAIDTDGNVYLTGGTSSTDFPTVNPLQPFFAGFTDLFVSKLNADGSALLYSTYLGGSRGDGSAHIAVDQVGNVYLTGGTDSSDFPTRNPFQSEYAGNTDAFVTKIHASGGALEYSTYLGGRLQDSGNDIAVDRIGRAYVTGFTASDNFPTVNALQPALAESLDAFIVEFNRTGSKLRFSTYLGGSERDRGMGLSLDSRGNIYVAGSTFSRDFPTVNAVQSTSGSISIRDDDAFVVKVNPKISRLVYSTYLGGLGSDAGWGIAEDARGNAYVVGNTASSNFPVTPEAFQRVFRGPLEPVAGGDAFIAKIGNRRHHADSGKDR